MQMMPASAKRAAAMSHLEFRPNDLNKPDYNMQLGMATLAENLDRWGGSWRSSPSRPATMRGPSNVRNWVDANGDPRGAGVDPIDWIESIPFPETRNYVQRVLENLEVYRNRLNNSDQNLVILSDLYRPNPVNLANIRQAYSISASSVLNTVLPVNAHSRSSRRPRNDRHSKSVSPSPVSRRLASLLSRLCSGPQERTPGDLHSRL